MITYNIECFVILPLIISFILYRWEFSGDSQDNFSVCWTYKTKQAESLQNVQWNAPIFVPLNWFGIWSEGASKHED